MQEVDEDEIRILDLLPYGVDGPQSPLICQLRVVKLSDNPVYDALSYRWGNPGSRRCIFVDSHEVSVTESLHAALLRLRQKDAEKHMWIDQLCINQQNPVEKAIQVRLMKEVYSKCNHCFNWLEEIEDNIPLADAEACLEMLRWMADSSSLAVPACLASVSDFKGPSQALSNISPGVHPWWERVWTVQEIILPARKSFLWGPLQLSWDTLTACARIWTQIGIPMELRSLIYETHLSGPHPITETVMGLLFCNVVWINDAQRGVTSPIDPVMKWNGRNSTDQRDKVFGILGLVPQHMELCYTSKCDYDISVARVYTAFMLDVLLDQGLIFLAILQRKVPSKRNTDMPTWVFDLSDGEMQIRAEKFYLHCRYDSYDTCAGRVLDKTALVADVETWTSSSPAASLRLTGVAIDSIAVIGARFPDNQHVVVEPARIAECLRSWMETARKYHMSICGGISEDEFARQFCRASVGNRFQHYEQGPIKPPTEQEFTDFGNFMRSGQGKLNNFWHVCRHVNSQTFFITTDGTMGMGNWDVEVGDEIWAVDGGKMPIAIRPVDGERRDFTFRSCCYLDGVMDGEIYDGRSRCALDQQRTIRLH